MGNMSSSCTAPPATEYNKLMDAFVSQCLHDSNDYDWVPIEAVTTAFAAFIHYENVRESKRVRVSGICEDLLKERLNSKYNLFTFGSPLYSVVIGVELTWPTLPPPWKDPANIKTRVAH
jgi:hypothetical protein